MTLLNMTFLAPSRCYCHWTLPLRLPNQEGSHARRPRSNDAPTETPFSNGCGSAGSELFGTRETHRHGEETHLGGGFKYFLFSSLFGEDYHFD